MCMQGNGAELLLQSVNLIEAGVVALDGERDPRCLLLAFQSIRDLSFLYAEHSPEVSHLVCHGDGTAWVVLIVHCKLR